MRTGERERRQNPRIRGALRKGSSVKQKPTAFAVGLLWLTKRDECRVILRIRNLHNQSIVTH